MKIATKLGFGVALLAGLCVCQYQTATAQANQWGTVKGKITWGGKVIPKQEPIAAVMVNPDKMACMAGGNIVVDEKYVVNPKNKGLRYAFVWLEQADPANKAPLPVSPSLKEIKNKQIVLDQPLCAFTPHAFALRQGQEILAKNTSTIGHNLKWAGFVNAGNNVLIPAGQSFAIKDLKVDRIPLKFECNIHPWMNGYVMVFDHPYFAVTDANGAFEIKDAPVGDYRLVVRHGEGGWMGGAKGKQGKKIAIKGGAATDLGDTVFPEPDE